VRVLWDNQAGEMERRIAQVDVQQDGQRMEQDLAQ
jgi:hypothetical protein